MHGQEGEPNNQFIPDEAVDYSEYPASLKRLGASLAILTPALLLSCGLPNTSQEGLGIPPGCGALVVLGLLIIGLNVTGKRK